MLALLIGIGLTILIVFGLSRLFEETAAWPLILLGLIFCPMVTLVLIFLGLAFLALPFIIIIGIIVLIIKAIVW